MKRKNNSKKGGGKMSIELYLSIAGIVIIVVTIVTGLEIRKISKEINEIDIEK